MKGLPVKLGTSHPEIDDSGFAAALGDRSDSGKTVDVLGRFIPRAVRAKEGTEPRSQSWPGAGQMVEQTGLGMGLEGSCDAMLVSKFHFLKGVLGGFFTGLVQPCIALRLADSLNAMLCSLGRRGLILTS